MSDILPDCSLDCLVDGNAVNVYAQTMNGDLVECSGSTKTRRTITAYTSDGQYTIIKRYFDEDELEDNAPKLFTPLAAVKFQDRKYLFYIDDENTIQGVHMASNNRWEDCGLSSQVRITCAAYSQLSAAEATSSASTYRGIVVYYQSAKRNAGIDMVSFSTKTGRWTSTAPDLSPDPPQPAPRVVDPPLYGTALSAVEYRREIGFIEGSELPVVFLQWSDLMLAHAQGSEPEVISTVGIRFAPHTSLAVVDDGSALYCFYTSSRNNNIKVIRMDDNNRVTRAQEFGTPTPRSAITTAYVPALDQIMVFHARLEAAVNVVQLVAITLVRSASQMATTGWEVSRYTVMG